MKIKVFHKTYAVAYVPEPTTKEGDKPNGFCDFDKSRIVVSSSVTENDRREILLHELIHAIDDAMYIKLKEAEVRQLSVGLFTLFRDNPKLADYIFKGK